MSDIARWADTFILAKCAEGVSRKTVIAYTNSLKKFLTWAEGLVLLPLKGSRRCTYANSCFFLVEAGHNSGGQHRYYRVLKTFLRWYEAEVEPEGWKNPIRKVKPPAQAN